MASKAQLWARERNWSKRLIKGTYYLLVRIRRQSSTVPIEEVDLVKITSSLDRILRQWEANNRKSKELFLKGR